MKAGSGDVGVEWLKKPKSSDTEAKRNWSGGDGARWR